MKMMLVLVLLLVGYSMQQCTNGSIRLSSQQYGAVEVCLNGTWGSICSDYWDSNDASVICRQLGYSPYGALGPAVTHTSSSTPSHNIIDLNCTGQESSIIDCPFNGLIGQYSCSNTRDANVYCQDSNLVMYSNCTDGQMRLVNGSDQYQGRVEVCVNNAWGTVCSSSWSSSDAKVVCRYVGALTIGYQYSRVTSYGFNYGHGPILLGYLYCSGQEKSLIDCNQNYYSTNSASACKQHRYDAAVIFEPHCNNGTVRLKGGSYTYGRVELCINEIWTTICSDHWNYKDSSVVCNQLGYSPYGAVPASGYYSEYVWSVGIINPNCTGNETSILNCSHNQTESCSPSHDASVICQNVTTEPVSCVTGDIRLIGGSTGNEGRLEVCINEMWGTVCSQRWGASDTRVACKQLGHQKLGGVQYGSSQYGQGTGPVFLGYMNCTGSEDSLFECGRSVFGVVNSLCSRHYYDIRLKCEPVCEHGTVRLQGGTSSTGRVEVCVNGTWGTLCSDFWDNNDATVVCNQLGYSPYGAIAVSGYYSTSVWPHHIIDLNCTGTEGEILNCSYNGLHRTCLTNNDASVVCQSVDIQKDDCVDGDIRLAGGQTEYEGQVEICINKVWGTICGYGTYSWWSYHRWSTPDSNVVCTQLGHMELGSTAYRTASQFGQGTGPIFLSAIDCQGNEQNLLTCPYRLIHSTSCTHNYDVGVKCEAPCVNGTVRLYSESGSYFRRYGRVQVCINNAWGTVCDHFWDEQDASVVCRMLGYSSYGASALTDTFTEGVWYVHIKDLNCTGNELSIWDCPMNNLSSYSCNNYDDAAVVCQMPNVVNSNCTTNELRLTGGSYQYEGRVEYCVNGVWQSFCDYSWDGSDAYTVCRQLGYQEGRRVFNSHFGIGVTPVSIYYLSCQYYSTNLSQCAWNMLPSYSYCNNYQEAGVICEAPCTDGSIDLFGSSLINVGSVRVCINGSWSKVCGAGNTLLDNELASVACYSAGFSKYGATSFQGQWSDRKYPFKFYNMKCYGNESNLHECDYDTKGTCSISYALGVSCQQEGFITSPANCTDNDIKFFEGSSGNYGTLLICINGAWTRVCTDNHYYWSNSNTDVVCRQLGYTIYGNTHRQVSHQQVYPTTFFRFSCRGSEASFSSCRSYLYFSTPQYCYLTIEITCTERCTTGSTRLIGSHYYGRVEICVGGVWGTICRDSFWDNTDASVVCKQLGFSPYGAIAVPNNWYSISTTFNFAGELSCSGNETYILECPFNSSSSCPPNNDANVICPVHSSTYSNCTDGDIKLLNGSTEYEGRVEICINKAWGTITYFYGTSNEAQTVCNQLGYTAPGAIKLNNAYFGEGSGPVLLTYVSCSTPRNSLMNCYLGHTRRAYYRDRNSVIGVRCQTYCEHGSIRLTGLDPLQGRVEVCVNGTWGSVCNDYWHNSDARVVCRQLGFPTEGAVARVINYFGTSFSFHIIDLNCNGSEETVLNCSYNNIKQHSCQWYEDAYVQCQVPSTTDNCTNGVIRLVKGETENEGLVEICADGSWGYICPNYRWGRNEAMVTCRQLGYTTIGATTSFSFGKGAGPVHFSSFYCSGNQNNLLNCSHYTSSCSYSYHAGVICQAPCNEGEIRLQGDRRYNSFGRVEVCNGDTWGTICDDYWDNNDASVVCKQLGFSPYGAIAKTSFYREYVLPHIIFNMSCNGDEESIFNCSYSTEVPTGSNCHSSEDASVICQDIKVAHSNCIDYDVRLVGGETGNEGKVLMCLNGVWGTLCDNRFDTNDAGVVCNNAGYSKRGSRYSANFPNSSNEILLVADMYCSSTDERIEDCSITHYTPPSSCDVLDIVAVRCHICTDGDIRIIPYGTSSVGRVEVFSDNSWGTICNDFFDHADAQVICRQLGYNAIGSVSVGPLNDYLHYYHIIDINCTGTELSIQDCPSNNLTSYTCLANRDAGVSCNSISLNNYTNCTDGELRLVGGTELSGHVEICYNRVWYGVCSDNYNSYNTPNTICKGLGYSSQNAIGSIIETYPPLPLLPFEFNCYGNRDTLWDCSKSTIRCFNGPYKYAAVTCQAKCDDWEVRLYGSSFENIGAVEVCIDGEWSSVCYEDFDFSDAATVCTQLGYIPYGAIVLPRYSYRYSRTYYISDLNCTGDEKTIKNCSYTAPIKGSCVNAPLICQRNNESVDATCTDGSVRLAGGINELEGNVEICHNKFWGSVCHSRWNTIDANIACKQLGHQPSGAKVFFRSYFGHSSSGTHIMSNVYCSNSAASLLDCSYNSLSAFTSCGDLNRAGVICLDACDNGTLRLSGSNTESAGRVEICIESIWTSLCDQNWDLKDAQVACRELGYSPYGAMPTYGCYTEGQLSFGITSINCTGSENALLNCSHSNPVLYNCRSHNDAGLICQNNIERSNCSNGSIRLVDGSGPHEGRLEVCVNEAWGTVCSNGWDNSDSKVVCNQLGYLPFGERHRSFGQGTNISILMSNLQCRGTERSLLECYQQACNVLSCTHRSDVGVVCETPCINGSIRLGDGAVLRGRVEVCYNGSWVTICSHSWTAKEATVICSHLGYSHYGAIAVSNAFINNEWPMSIYNLNCTGNETSLWDCQFTTSYNGRYCGQSNDASVFCMPNTTQYSNCTDGDVRLVGGRTSNEGNVQICYKNAWGSVCDDSWGTADSNVVCRQLGLQPYGSSAYYSNRYGVYNPFVYGRFYCSGIEKTLIDCPKSSSNYLLYCRSYEIAGAQCIGACTDGKVRIRGSYNAHIGRVEVCVNGTWVTVCDENWDDNDAAVICHQLGHSAYGAMAAYGSIISDSYPTRVYGVNCTGSERKLFDCPVHLLPPGVSYSSCSQNDAGVICQGSQTMHSNCTNGDVRLRNGATLNQGRVEICVKNAWGTVCDDGWGKQDGNVVCKQLGYQQVGSKPTYRSSYGSSGLPIMLANLACTGNENTLLDCNRNRYSVLNCHMYELAGVECQELCTNGEVRIVGSSSLIGRVEVCVNQTWGTVCDTAWNDKAASVVCRQLGFSPYGAIAAKNGFSVLLLPTHINSIDCSGTEESVFHCAVIYERTNSVCGNRNDAGVICQDNIVTPTNCEHGKLRLVGGPTHTEGRVEICINGVWGTVCDNGWNTIDANIACDQLGYYPTGAKARYGSFYGSGTGPIFLSNLFCTGSELSLLECNRDMYSVRNCRHYEDAGVKCIGSFPVYTSQSVGSMLGGEIIVVTGPAFKSDDNILCEFGNIETVGIFLSENKCLCVTPQVANDGVVQLNIKITRAGSATLNGGTKFRFVLPFDLENNALPAINVEDGDSYSVGTSNKVNVTWSEYALTGGFLSEYSVTLNISMMLYNTDTDEWEESYTLAPDVPASDERAEVIIPEYPQIDETTLRLSQIRVSLSTITPSNHRQKRLLPALAIGGLIRVAGRAIIRYAWKKTKQKIKDELKEAERSAKLRLACELWHKLDRGVNNRQLPPCPCKKSQANRDDRYTKENIVQDLWREKVFKRDKASGGCYRQSNVGSFSPSQQCCYGIDENILTGTNGGSAYSVYPNNWKSFLGHLARDIAPHYLCCNGKYFSGCQDRYYDRRPNDNCEDYPERPPPARTFGDPHLVSLDGTQYTFNGHGEFILVQSIDGSLMIQARMTEPQSTRDSNETLIGSGTVITAIVAKHNESDTVQFEVVNGQLITLVNGDEIDFTELAEQQFKNLTVLDKGNHTVSATLANGITITVTENINILSDVSVTLSNDYYGSTVGLLGQYNGKPEDDLLSKNGNTTLPSNASTEEIHYEFGLTWILANPLESLFTYDDTGSWNTFYKPEYKPIFQPQFNDSALEEKAQEICGDDKLCLFDIAATGDVNIGQSTRKTGQELTTITELLKPIFCDSPCIHGACVDNNTCFCSEGYEGVMCNDTILQDCEEDFCLNGATCQIVAGTYLCICSDGFTGPNCGTEIVISSPIPTTSTTPPGNNKASLVNTWIIISILVAVFLLIVAVITVSVCLCLIKKRPKSYTRNEYDAPQMIEKLEMK